ncbi:MAG: Tol-Pal system subunit TolQ [Thermodesulfobacteria bacterium]|nr:Tol-Pal system subunit TolQ [Thermodesulfobacteriota bacterium]
MNLWEAFLRTSLTGKVVLLVLFLMSIQSWYVMFVLYFRYKWFNEEVEKAKYYTEVSNFKDFVKVVKELEKTGIAKVFKKILAIFADIYEEYIERAEGNIAERIKFAEEDLKEAISVESEEFLKDLDKGLGFLATVGNVAPFIGLFGTVWGIMQAFHEIGLKGSANLATVAPGIAEALINTAMGLFCAIPAVIAYNYFLTKKEGIYKKCEVLFRKVFLLVKKGFLKNL